VLSVVSRGGQESVLSPEVDGRALASLMSECLEGNDEKLRRLANTHGLSQEEADCIGVDDVGRQ
jgi:hypothetical protein